MSVLFSDFKKLVMIIALCCLTRATVTAIDVDAYTPLNYAEIASAGLIRLPLVVLAKNYESEHTKKALIIKSLAGLSRIVNNFLHTYNHWDDNDRKIALLSLGFDVLGLAMMTSDEWSYQEEIKEQIDLLQKKAESMGRLLPSQTPKKQRPVNKIKYLLGLIEGGAAIYKACDNTDYPQSDIFNNRRIASFVEVAAQS